MPRASRKKSRRRKFHYSDPLTPGDTAGLAIAGVVGLVALLNLILNYRRHVTRTMVQKHKEDASKYRQKYQDLKTKLLVQQECAVPGKVDLYQARILSLTQDPQLLIYLSTQDTEKVHTFVAAMHVLKQAGESSIRRLLRKRDEYGDLPPGWPSSFLQHPGNFIPSEYVGAAIGLYRQLLETRKLEPQQLREKYPIGLPKDCISCVETSRAGPA